MPSYSKCFHFFSFLFWEIFFTSQLCPRKQNETLFKSYGFFVCLNVRNTLENYKYCSHTFFLFVTCSTLQQGGECMRSQTIVGRTTTLIRLMMMYIIPPPPPPPSSPHSHHSVFFSLLSWPKPCCRITGNSMQFHFISSITAAISQMSKFLQDLNRAIVVFYFVSFVVANCCWAPLFPIN